MKIISEGLLRVVPTTLRKANAFVADKHRHHPPVTGCRFCVAVADMDMVRGVLIAGRPVARMIDDGFTLEITRCCTDGTRNACSMLYAAARAAGRALGYTRIVTYTLPEEGGVSLRAAGFELMGEAGGGSWCRKGRPRADLAPTQRKFRWEAR